MHFKHHQAFVLSLSGWVLGVILLAHAAGAQADGWTTHAGNAHHTGLSSVAAQPFNVIHWATPVDLAPPSGEILIHYGSPLVSAGNTVIVPVKTRTEGGYLVKALNAGNGSVIWSQATDYILPPHHWTPSYSPALTPGNRLYFPGAGGTVYFRDNVDSGAPASIGQLAFFGMADYSADPASFNGTVFINTPITPDSAGNIYFGFRTSGTAPLGLKSGIARIDASGNGTWVSAVDASGGDAAITRVPHQAAPALSNDEQTLYVIVASDSTDTNRYLVGLDPATLALKEASPGVKMRVVLKDPRGGVNNAVVPDDSSATPMVGPDGDVYFGVLGNPSNGSRGWMLHFSGDLSDTKTPGAFGWDNTASIVPGSMVPSYAGTSRYLIFTKQNNYAGLDGGNGVNRVAVLDPNDTMPAPHPSSNGLLVMKEVLSIAGPTPDPDAAAQFPNAVREWCINTAAVDPFTRSIMVNSEDGKLYRWDLTTNRLSQSIALSPGVGEAYTPTAIGPDGTVYAINMSVLNAVGSGPAISIDDISVFEGNNGLTNATFTVTLSSSSSETVSVRYATANATAKAGRDYIATSGTVTFAPGETSETILVPVIGDQSPERDETFIVRLTSPANAAIARGEGRGSILNDHPHAVLRISDVSVIEGNSGTRDAVFLVTLSAAKARTVSVDYATVEGTANAGSDYVATAGTLTFNPGEKTKRIVVQVIGDTVKERNETFTVHLSNPVNAPITKARGRGTILNDDR